MPAINILTIDNNIHKGNQEILDENRAHFNSQTELVLSILKEGKTVSSLSMIKHGILDTRARIFAIKKAGYKIGERKIVGGKGAKEWFMIFDNLFSHAENA